MKTKTGLSALNETLFMQLEKLTSEDLTGEELEMEIKRADAINDVSSQILEGQKLAFKIMEHADEYGYNRKNNDMPKMLELSDE